MYFEVTKNVGVLFGMIIIPILAQMEVNIAFLVPLCAITIGLFIFLLGSKRYVCKPKVSHAGTFCTSTFLLCNNKSSPKSNEQSSGKVQGFKGLLNIVWISLLLIPFMTAYFQMYTVMVIQGYSMKSVWLIDEALIQFLDPVSAILVGCFVTSFLYPFLSKRGIKIPTTYKFAIATSLGLLSIGYTSVVDYLIRRSWTENGKDQVSIIYQAPVYAFASSGAVFAFSALYEIVFLITPNNQKNMAAGIATLLTLALGSYICSGMDMICQDWFPMAGDDIDPTEAYVNSHLNYYNWIKFGIQVFGIIINVLPFVKNTVERLSQEAAEDVTIGNDSTTDSSFCLEVDESQTDDDDTV